MKTKLLLLLAVVMTAFSVNAQYTVVSITGQGVGGWGDGFDFDMTSPDGVNWSGTINILNTAINPGTDGIKFRADHAWTVNWGDAAWPSGTGTQGGANIQCVLGTYDVTFNSTTGEYTFTGGGTLPTVKLVGTAVTGGTVDMIPTSPITFTLPLTTFLDGNAQFEVDGELAGGTGFPTGTFVDATQFIPVTAGSYSSVTVNIETGEYTFTAAPLFATITLTGSAIVGADWGVDTADFGHTDADNYFLNDVGLLAVDGCKFRKDHDWATTWGSAAFPSGTADGNNIVVTTAGNYDAKINIVTGAYSFGFPVISLTGDAVGGWGDGFDNDLTTTDGTNYTLNNFTIANSAGCKFRRGHAWDLSYGGDVFPTGAPGNGNIPAVAGTYNITFNVITKEYNFGPALATTSFAKSNFKVYPNPSNTNWNFTSAKDVITSIQIVDMLGKVVATSTSTIVDASALTTGVYFAKVATATATETIKVVKN